MRVSVPFISLVLHLMNISNRIAIYQAMPNINKEENKKLYMSIKYFVGCYYLRNVSLFVCVMFKHLCHGCV